MRPTFKHNGYTVRAAGVLVLSDGYRLLRRVRGRYEDVGGKTDAVDTCALDTAVREAVGARVEPSGSRRPQQLPPPHHSSRPSSRAPRQGLPSQSRF